MLKMGTDLKLGDIPVQFVHKNVKHIRLRIVPPLHKVQISVPRQVPIETAQALAMGKYEWLRDRLAVLRMQEAAMAADAPRTPSCLFWGRRYIVQFVATEGSPQIVIDGEHLQICTNAEMPQAKRDAFFECWYRAELLKAVDPIIAKWEAIMNVRAGRIALQRMKTRWGTCNNATRTIRINVDLVQKPPELLEYLIVHEMTHFHHNNHGADFQEAMDGWMSNWRALQRELDVFPRF